MISPRSFLAILAAKAVSKIIQRLGTSGGTSAPGLLAERVDPKLLSKLSAKLKNNIVVSGTNGKTTTANLIAQILTEKKLRVIQNKAGSNLTRGLLSQLAQKADLVGRVKADIGVWEVDEATLPQAISQIRPQLIGLLNLFRDQLDRYGEIDKIRQKWGQILKKMPKQTTLILNGDDPGIAILGENFRGEVVHFGINALKIKTVKSEEPGDVRFCLKCNKPLYFRRLYSSHLGIFSCSACGFRRKSPTISIEEIRFGKNMQIKLTAKKDKFLLKTTLPGLYNAYNILAATAIALQLGVSKKNIYDGLRNLGQVFGRVEQIQLGKKKIMIHLVKNPTGFNEVIKTLLVGKKSLPLYLLLNDNLADGTDVSWIWDVSLEGFRNKLKFAICSGTRAEDLTLRLKYAGIDPKILFTQNDIYRALQKSFRMMSNNDTLHILPTYTALLDLKRSLSRFYRKPRFWETE